MALRLPSKSTSIENLPIGQLCRCRGSIPPGALATRTAWAAVALDGFGRAMGFGLGGGAAKHLIGRDLEDFAMSAPRSVVGGFKHFQVLKIFVRKPKIGSGCFGKEKMGNGEGLKPAGFAIDRFSLPALPQRDCQGWRAYAGPRVFPSQSAK